MSLQRVCCALSFDSFDTEAQRQDRGFVMTGSLTCRNDSSRVYSGRFSGSAAVAAAFCASNKSNTMR